MTNGNVIPKYIVTYTSIDNKVRTCSWGPQHKGTAPVIKKYLETNEWTDEKYNKPYEQNWGYRNTSCNIGAFHYHGQKRKLCYSHAECDFYKDLLSEAVIYYGLAKECLYDDEFASEILKAATNAEKDRGNSEYDVLRRTKNRIRSYSKKEDEDRKSLLAREYTSLIQEFELFKVLDIQRGDDDFFELKKL